MNSGEQQHNHKSLEDMQTEFHISDLIKFFEVRLGYLDHDEIIDPADLGGNGAHYFQAWCPSVL